MIHAVMMKAAAIAFWSSVVRWWRYMKRGTVETAESPRAHSKTGLPSSPSEESITAPTGRTMIAMVNGQARRVRMRGRDLCLMADTSPFSSRVNRSGHPWLLMHPTQTSSPRQRHQHVTSFNTSSRAGEYPTVPSSLAASLAVRRRLGSSLSSPPMMAASASMFSRLTTSPHDRAHPWRRLSAIRPRSAMSPTREYTHELRGT
jgi:hypothetical protein